jgi:hypothetical protein
MLCASIYNERSNCFETRYSHEICQVFSQGYPRFNNNSKASWAIVPLCYHDVCHPCINCFELVFFKRDYPFVVHRKNTTGARRQYNMHGCTNESAAGHAFAPNAIQIYETDWRSRGRVQIWRNTKLAKCAKEKNHWKILAENAASGQQDPGEAVTSLGERPFASNPLLQLGFSTKFSRKYRRVDPEPTTLTLTGSLDTWVLSPASIIQTTPRCAALWLPVWCFPINLLGLMNQVQKACT